VAAPSVLKQRNTNIELECLSVEKKILERLKDILRNARDEIKSMEEDETIALSKQF
jgi:hypothetical protein